MMLSMKPSCQDRYVKDIESLKDLLSFPVTSTVAMQHEDGGPWMHKVFKR